MKLYGVFGFPAFHSLSPQMHNAAFKASNLSSYFLSLELDPVSFQSLRRQKKKLLLSGFNLTIPYKQAVLPSLDTRSLEVRSIGACNTVVIEKGRWHGENTDAYGFLKGLTLKGFNPKGKDAAILGAGGATRAVIYGLLEKKVRSLVILNRTFSKAESLMKFFAKQFPKALLGAAALNSQNIKALLPQKDLIVNATSLGLSSRDGSPVSLKDLPRAKRGALAYDLIYSKETPFLKAAKRRGYKVQNGQAMLLHQGARAWELWTGRKAPLKVMERALRVSRIS